MPARHLFIDDEIDFYDLRGLQKVLNQPEKHPANPLLVREHPWESATVQLYGSVLYDYEENLFKMWYLAGPDCTTNQPEIIVNGHQMTGLVQAYAISSDGIHWEKPELGLVSFEGSKKNNIVPIGHHGVEGMCVLKEEHEPDPGRRYKAIWWDHDKDSIEIDSTGMVVNAGVGGLHVAWSSDGIHWEEHPGNPMITCFSDTGQQLVWDTRHEIYAAFGRLAGGGRVIERSESPDLVHWSQPELVFRPDDMDRMGTQFYGMGTSMYEGLYLGMPWVLAQRQADTRSLGNDGRIHIQLASSRDGIHWQRAGGRSPFIPNGKQGEWDGGIIYTANAPVIKRDKVFIYYSGASWPHEPGSTSSMPRGIGLASLRRDGFISLDAGDDEGNFGTIPFMATETQGIHLNLDATNGRVFARLCDPIRCEPLPGIEPSEPIHGDHMDTTVHWSRGQMKQFQGKSLSVRIYGQRTKFYSYWFNHE